MSALSEHSIFVSRELQVQQNWLCLQFYLSSFGHDLNLEIQPRQFAAGFGNLNYLITLVIKHLINQVITLITLMKWLQAIADTVIYTNL